jgi:uncharacterized protein (TIGR03067 family)
MTPFRLLLVALIGFTFASARLHAEDDANKKDTQALQGRWKLTTVERNGEEMALGDNPPRWTIKDGKVFYAGDLLAELTLSAGAKPKCIDLAWAKPRGTYEGIYLLDGDTLKICVNRQTEGVKNRPEDFTTAGHADLRLLVFQRDKAEKPDPLDGVNGFVGMMIGINEQKEVFLAGLLDGSPAKKAGLLKDDVLVAVAGAEAANLQMVIDLVRRQKPGDELTVKVKRSGKEEEIRVKVGKMPFFYLD